MPPLSVAQEPSASGATSQGVSARDGSAAAHPEAAMAGPLQDEAEAVSSGVAYGSSGHDAGVQPTAPPDQTEEGTAARLVAQLPQDIETAGGPGQDSRPAARTEQHGPAHAGAEESAICVAGAHGNAEPSLAQESGGTVARQEYPM